jgi:hypothetical protein
MRATGIADMVLDYILLVGAGLSDSERAMLGGACAKAYD